MPAILPNQKCTCGFTRFSTRLSKTTTAVERWMAFDATGFGGHGSTPHGMFYGAGLGLLWGLFNSTLSTTVAETTCESCHRVRSQKRLGGIAVFATFVDDDIFYVVGSDAGTPVTCFGLRFTGPETFEVPLGLSSTAPPAVEVPPPSVFAATPPPGASLVDVLLQAALPAVDTTANYTVELVDRCAGTTLRIATVVLEAEPMIFTPLDADLGGAPQAWIRGPGGTVPSGQPASGSRLSIPFDKCWGVVEYDARRGTLPGAQGFTHFGTGVAGNFQLVEGGALGAATVPGLPSYWRVTLPLIQNPGSAFLYAVAKPVNNPRTTAADGFGFIAEYATSVGGAYAGARIQNNDGKWRLTKLDNSSDQPSGSATNSYGWQTCAVASFDTGPDEVWTMDGQNAGFATATLFGTQGIAGAFEAVVGFGDFGNRGINSYLRGFVASFGGRFIRAGFTAFAQVTTPLVRLYVCSDANASVQKTARFRIRYAPSGTDPYAEPALIAEATVNLTAANTVYAVPFQLTGLVAAAPFDFSVERVWDSGSDGLEATVHLLYATVRSL